MSDEMKITLKYLQKVDHLRMKYESIFMHDELTITEKLKAEMPGKIQQMVEDFEDLANYSGIASEFHEFFLLFFVNTHRYLQGEMITELLRFIQKYSILEDKFIDPRNEYAVELCKVVTKALEEDGRFSPIILRHHVENEENEL